MSASGGVTSGECSTASSSCGSNSVSPTQGRTICDKPELTQITALPDFKSFQKPVLADGGTSITSKCLIHYYSISLFVNVNQKFYSLTLES